MSFGPDGSGGNAGQGLPFPGKEPGGDEFRAAQRQTLPNGGYRKSKKDPALLTKKKGGPAPPLNGWSLAAARELPRN